jgi:hypothetical protein
MTPWGLYQRLRFFPLETVTPEKNLKAQDEGVVVQGNSSGRRKGMREPQGISELLRQPVRLVARGESVGLVCGLNGLIQPHPGIVPMSADGFLGDLQDLG